MNSPKAILVANRNYFICYLLVFAIGLILLLSLGKATSFIALNPYHRSALDTFFVYVTFLGDGRFAIVICLIYLVLRRWSQALQLIAAFLISALVAQILKNVFSMPRPKQYFGAGYSYFIDGVTHIGFASFPSGHTTSVFALATLLAIFDGNKTLNSLYLLAAVAVGYSRIYLGQHFLGDVLVGSLIGVVTAIGIHWLFLSKWPSRRAAAAAKF
ncbi:MAG TPA: phosphatase PAP2 family protein [Puia sp.]|jgi:membrane-associated phospholipid phosphatase|nr:phosphatase PAP2 family protein [Puia sp.]